ncbi:MAG: endonuclease [Clostridia bacterium]|nr:endonuclease [Clostridia bacterium]
MKNNARRVAVVLLVLTLLVSILYVPSGAAGTQPSSYSTSSNSGTRHVVCTTLDGTRTASYYMGSYTYDNLSGLSQSALLSSLRTLMTSTHSKTTSYDDCKNYANKTDCENNSGKMVSLYSSYTTYYNASDINREHVWPKSLGGYNTSGPGADLHHIRPTEITPNSNRGSLRYGNVSGGKTSYGNASGYEAGWYGSYFEPLDNVKGDVARICLYMYARYGGDSSYTCSNITKVFESVDVLLEWCKLDPVDTWEMGRNEVIAKIQGNRNVFIDYPEYAWLVFGRSVPDDMVTPSGEAMSQGSGSGTGSGTGDGTCTHVWSAWTVTKPASYTENGTQTRTCSSCGESETESIPKLACSHPDNELIGRVEADCGNDGFSGNICCTECGAVILAGSVLPATQNHSWSDWKVITEPTRFDAGIKERTCQGCDQKEHDIIPKLPDDEEIPVITTDKKDDSTVITVVVIVAGSGALAAGGITTFAIMRKRRFK